MKFEEGMSGKALTFPDSKSIQTTFTAEGENIFSSTTKRTFGPTV